MFLRCLINELGLKIWSLCFIPHFLCQAASNFRFYRRLGTKNNFPGLIWSQGALFKIMESRILPCVHQFSYSRMKVLAPRWIQGFFFFFKHFDRCFVDFSTFEHDVRHPQKVFNPQQKCLPNIEDCPIQSHFEFYNQTKGQSMFYTVWGYFFFIFTSYYVTRNESEIV